MTLLSFSRPRALRFFRIPLPHSPSGGAVVVRRALRGAVLCALLLSAGLARAETAVNIRTGVHKDFERLVFDWPQPVTFQSAQTPGALTLTFAQSAQFNLGAFSAAGLQLVRRAEAVGSNAVRLILAENVQASAFSSGNRVVVDVRRAREAAAATPAPDARAESATAAGNPPDEPRPSVRELRAGAAPAPNQVEPKNAAVPVASPAVMVAEAAPLTPAMPEGEAAGPVDGFAAAVQAAARAPDAAQSAGSLSSGAFPSGDAPAGAFAPAPSAAPRLGVEQRSLPTESLIARFRNPLVGPPLEAAPYTFLTLDPGIETALAVYERGGFVYVFFDRLVSRPAEQLIAGGPPPRVPLTWLSGVAVTALAFPAPDGGEIRVNRDGTAWQIIVASQKRTIPINLGLAAQPDFALGARLMGPARDAGEMIVFTDPILGDSVRILPMRNASDAMSLGWRYADFRFIPAAQGLVILPQAEDMRMRAVTDGFEITMPGGLRLSPVQDTGQVGQDDVVSGGVDAKLFRFSEWGRLPGEDHATARRRFMQTVVDVPEAERDRARYALARFYFAEGYTYESLSLLNDLLRRQPDLRNRPEFRALRGAMRALSGQPIGAQRDLSIPELADSLEVALWRAVANAERRDWPAAARDFALADAHLASYPEPYFSRFHLLAIEALLAEDRLTEAADLLARFEKGGRKTEQYYAATAYLRGALQAKNGYPKRAERFWRQAATSNDHLYRTRAIMALVDLDVAQKKLNAKAAAERLEGLRFAWRGDDLELDLLRRLGSFYLDANMVKEALTTFGDAVRLKPDSPFNAKLREDMAAAFLDSFMGARAAVLSPLDALAIYEEFSDLAPKGAEGEKLIANLVDRLVAVDLLDRAAQLLQEQVNRFPQPARAATAARLAAIRLMDGKPEAALASLRETSAEGLPDDLVMERKLLQARALSDLGQYETAMNLLAEDGSAGAVRLKADIAWRAEKWSVAASMFRQLLPPPGAGQELTQEQAQLLVNLAISEALSGDNATLNSLRAEYAGSLPEGTFRDSFLVLTRPDDTETPLNAQAIMARVSEVDLFGNFLRAYRGEALQ